MSEYKPPKETIDLSGFARKDIPETMSSPLSLMPYSSDPSATDGGNIHFQPAGGDVHQTDYVLDRQSGYFRFKTQADLLGSSLNMGIGAGKYETHEIVTTKKAKTVNFVYWGGANATDTELGKTSLTKPAASFERVLQDIDPLIINYVYVLGNVTIPSGFKHHSILNIYFLGRNSTNTEYQTRDITITGSSALGISFYNGNTILYFYKVRFFSPVSLFFMQYGGSILFYNVALTGVTGNVVRAGLGYLSLMLNETTFTPGNLCYGKAAGTNLSTDFTGIYQPSNVTSA